METILITGGTGFLGSKIVERLLSDNKKVIILVRESSSLRRIENSLNHPNLIKVVIKEDSLGKCFIENNVDAIIHTATSYGRNRESWPEVAEANLILPLQLLSMGEKAGVKCFLNADTFFNENIKFEKNESYYVQTKKSFLNTAEHAASSIKIKFVNLRIEQMYGPDDGEKKFIPSIINQLLSSAESISMTPGEQKRDFVYVDDVVNAFIHSLENYSKLGQFEEFGVGTGSSFTIKEIVTYLKEITGSKTDLVFGGLKYRENEIMDSRADLSNNKKIEWQPETSWQEGLKKTVDFYMN